ncbi:MAG: hypothetical protein H7125_17630, partial [Proteobacteria bacterium]|nr:hypothetical protein [Burkholderiales bacterium]
RDAPLRAAEAFEERVRALGLPTRLSQLPIPRDGLRQIVQDSMKNFNADPKREFSREPERLLQVLEAAW